MNRINHAYSNMLFMDAGKSIADRVKWCGGYKKFQCSGCILPVAYQSRPEQYAVHGWRKVYCGPGQVVWRLEVVPM
ncbi:hypothetical protein J6590_042143 [Homalodisca vitripennis]|nr:hypothetical protein J6590_042143 [Homalodisca vitripennis]